MGFGLIMSVLSLETLIAMRLVREDFTEDDANKLRQKINDTNMTHTRFLSQ